MLPPKNGKPITFKPTIALRETTEAIADSLGESLSDYVRKAVEMRNAQYKQPEMFDMIKNATYVYEGDNIIDPNKQYKKTVDVEAAKEITPIKCDRCGKEIKLNDNKRYDNENCKVYHSNCYPKNVMVKSHLKDGK